VIPHLHLILDLDALPDHYPDPVTLAAAAVAGGVGAVHLRGPARAAGDLLTQARRLHQALKGRALILVNDRLDVALAAQVDGVQLPESGLPPAAVRELAETNRPDDAVGGESRTGRLGGADESPRLTQRPKFLIGCSVHDAASARAAEVDGADFLLVGTVFASQSHPGRVPGGVALIRTARAACRIPLIAIGGISTANAGEVVRAGANGVAVIRAITEAQDPRAVAAALLHTVRHGLETKGEFRR
jgi:thiamine-phosphate pyrophosphorylase